jgi:hypothetical protein
MHARLQDGPGAGQKFDNYADPPPQTALFCAGGKFPAKVHRYELANVDRTPPDPEATYKDAGRVN